MQAREVFNYKTTGSTVAVKVAFLLLTCKDKILMMKMKCQLIFYLSSGSNTAHLMVLKLRFKYCCRDDGETNDDDEQKNVIDAGRLSD